MSILPCLRKPTHVIRRIVTINEEDSFHTIWIISDHGMIYPTVADTI
jgi:hypothetical protein